MPPEQKARVNIDRQLEQAGWLVQDASAANIRAALGVALREFPLKKGFADYLLYVDGKAIALMMQSFIYTYDQPIFLLRTTF
jgi:type I restriction enzyme R subunit